MKFIALASSSSGNAYLLTEEGCAPLLLEAGIPIKRLREKLREHGVSITDLAGVFVSHGHHDHSKCVHDLLKIGVDLFMGQETAKELGVLYHHRAHVLIEGARTFVNPWVIAPFHLVHDVPCLGALIGIGTERLIFVPDSGYVEAKFSGITMAAIECNHTETALSENIASGRVPAELGRRIRRNHASLETVIEMLKANDLSKCRQIFLMHLSDSNSDEARMVKEVQEATGVPTKAC